MRKSSRGAALVEFAITLPLLMILTLGTIDGARMFATWNRVKTGAREGAEYAQYFPLKQASGATCADPNNITARARNEGSDLTVAVSPVASPVCQDMTTGSVIQPGQQVSVIVTKPFTFLSPVAKLLWGNPTIKATVKVTVQG